MERENTLFDSPASFFYSEAVRGALMDSLMVVHVVDRNEAAPFQSCMGHMPRLTNTTRSLKQFEIVLQAGCIVIKLCNKSLL